MSSYRAVCASLEVVVPEPRAADQDPVFTPGVPRRPLTAFLSYSRSQESAVGELQRQLRCRGVRAWRDVTSLDLGGEFAEDIRRAIRHEVDALVAYITPQYLTSRIIWELEIPEALDRHRREPDFRVIPLFVGVRPSEVTAHCTARGLADLAKFNGDFLPARASATTRTDALAKAAGRTLKATLTHRVGQDRAYVPRLLLRTEPFEPGGDGVDLDLDWTEAFAGGCPTEPAWDATLLPALRDLRAHLSALVPSRRLAVEVQARLSAPLALGEALNAGGKFTLLVAGSDGTWPTDTRRRSQPVLVPEPLAATGDPRVALLEVSISREVGRAAAAHVSTIRPAPGRARRVRPIGGASQTAVEDASWAVTAAAEVADVMRTLHDEGVRCFYLYVAAPAAWCVLLGHQLNAVGQVVVYQRHPGSGEYLRGCSLGATWDHGLDALGA